MFLKARVIPESWKMDMSEILESSSSDEEHGEGKDSEEEEKEVEEEEVRAALGMVLGMVLGAGGATSESKPWNAMKWASVDGVNGHMLF